jgi:hypothetical protein
LNPSGPHDAGGSDSATSSFHHKAINSSPTAPIPATAASGSLDLVLAMTAHDTQKTIDTITKFARLNLDARFHLDWYMRYPCRTQWWSEVSLPILHSASWPRAAGKHGKLAPWFIRG